MCVFDGCNFENLIYFFYCSLESENDLLQQPIRHYAMIYMKKVQGILHIAKDIQVLMRADIARKPTSPNIIDKIIYKYILKPKHILLFGFI